MRSYRYAVVATCLFCSTVCRGEDTDIGVQKGDPKLPADAIRIEASHTGDFRRGQFAWTLNVDERGRASLKIVGLPSRSRQFSVAAPKLLQVRRAVETNDFFKLPDQIGNPIVDGSTRTVTIETGGKKKTLLIKHVASGRLSREERRALTVWVKVRNLFEDEFAVDSRSGDSYLLNPKKE